MDSSGGCSGLVGLDVGGIIYKTSSSTLMKNHGSFFSKMLEGHIPSAKDDNGNFIIDRDGQVFRHILNFMRCGRMVVPENFKEYTLLEHEADFYSLLELQKAVQEAVSSQAVSFVFDNHGETCCSEMLFRVTKETLSREDNSLFSKILRGDAAISKDSQGNLVMERDGNLFKHVNIYLKKGALFSDLDVPTLDILLKEAAYYSLDVLQDQIKSIIAMRQNIQSSKWASTGTPRLRLSIHVYRWVNGPCVVFANMSSGRFKPGSIKIHNKWNIGKLCKEDATICGGVFAGIIDKKKTMSALENDVDDIVKLVQRETSTEFHLERLQISKNCTKVIMN